MIDSCGFIHPLPVLQATIIELICTKDVGYWVMAFVFINIDTLARKVTLICCVPSLNLKPQIVLIAYVLVFTV